jgi:glycosyltransferase involved in cell wall biosynthesis
MRTGDRPPSVAFYSPGWPPNRTQNGIATYVGCVRTALRDLGVVSHVLTGATFGTDGVGADAIDLGRMTTPRGRRALFRLLGKVPGLSSEGASFGWSVARGLRQIVDQPPDLIEMEETFGGAWFTQQLMTVPVVVRLHGPWFLNGVALGVPVDAAFRRRESTERRCIARAAGVTSPSRDVLNRVRERYGLPLPDAAVIPNPVPPVAIDQRWTLEGSDRKTILFVGRFDRHKGGDLVIEAFTAIANSIPSAELMFVGPDRGFLDESGQVHSLPTFLENRVPSDLRSRVHVTGPLPAERIAGLRRRSYVTVVASRYENFPLALAEALAFGCPTIAADVGGMPEILLSEQTGLLFAAGDSGDLARKITNLFAHSERAAELGRRAAIDVANRLAPASIARLTLDYYQTLWSNPSVNHGSDRWRAFDALTDLVLRSFGQPFG